MLVVPKVLVVHPLEGGGNLMGGGRWDFPNRKKRGGIYVIWKERRGGNQKKQQPWIFLKKVYQRYDGLLKVYVSFQKWRHFGYLLLKFQGGNMIIMAAI